MASHKVKDCLHIIELYPRDLNFDLNLALDHVFEIKLCYSSVGFR